MKEEYHFREGWQSDVLVSIFTSATGKRPRTVKLASVLEDIRGDRYFAKICELRVMLASNRDQYNEAKKRLPAFIVSGTAKSRTEPDQHSNLLQVDLDKLGERLDPLRDRLKKDPHVAIGFVSPSKEGLKLGVAIDGTRHAESFQAASAYFRKRYGLRIDPRCRDRLRLCFVSYDPDLWINKHPVPLPIPQANGGEDTKRDNSSESCVLSDCVAASLDNCVSPSLHNTAVTILENITAKKQAEKVLETKHPKRAALYRDVIEPRFQAQMGQRNSFIVESVAFLYRAVGARFVLPLVECFYDCNRSLFHDSRQQHINEAKAMLESVTKTYADSLSTGERRIYEELNDLERDAFRICRDLALLQQPEREPFTFFMSFNQLGDRLGIFPTQAQRIMRQLAIYGLIKLVKKGTRREAGVRGEAGTYQWLLSSME